MLFAYMWTSLSLNFYGVSCLGFYYYYFLPRGSLSALLNLMGGKEERLSSQLPSAFIPHKAVLHVEFNRCAVCYAVGVPLMQAKRRLVSCTPSVRALSVSLRTEGFCNRLVQ